MTQSLPTTLGALRSSPFGAPALRGRSVKDEIRTNLLAKLATRAPLFPGVLGYEDLKALLGQIAPQQIPDAAIVIHNDQPEGLGFRLGRVHSIPVSNT